MDHTARKLCEDCGKPLPTSARAIQKRCRACKRERDKESSKISKRKSRNKKKISNILQKVFDDADFIRYFVYLVQGVMRNTHYHVNFYKEKNTTQGTMLASPEDLSPHAIDMLKTMVGQALSPQVQRDINRSLKQQEKRDLKKEEKGRNLDVFYSSKLNDLTFEPSLMELKLELKTLQKKLKWQEYNFLGLNQQKDKISEKIGKLEKKVKLNKKASF